MAKSLFSGKLSNGVAIELVEAETFSGKNEFAIKIAGEVASVSSVSVLRTGTVQVKTSAKSIRIDKKVEDPKGASSTEAPSLSDIKEKN